MFVECCRYISPVYVEENSVQVQVTTGEQRRGHVGRLVQCETCACRYGVTKNAQFAESTRLMKRHCGYTAISYAGDAIFEASTGSLHR